MLIAPSIIAGDQSRLGAEVEAITEAGADMIHLDIMDGHFVPNITIGPGVVKDLRRHTSLPFDCHLMLTDPLHYIEPFAKAGADRIAVHIEAREVFESVMAIKKLGKLAGIAINPDTDPLSVRELCNYVDFFVVMTVNPGFYGQSMILSALDKISVLRQTAFALGRRPSIQVDGGVNTGNVGLVANAGADEVVAGAAVFKANDYRAAIEGIRRGSAV